MSRSEPSFFRNELSAIVWTFRREWAMVALFSMVANVLMLSPTIYMLQVYDRVLVSRSELTLLITSLITLGLFVVMAWAERWRSHVLVGTSIRLDEALSSRVFEAAYQANLRQSGAPSQRAFTDLTELRQFLTGNGVFAFFDTPWAPVYVAVLFFLHPLLGWVAIGFALLQALLAWQGHRRLMAPAEAASKSQADLATLLANKFRNAEVVASMGMMAGLRQRWHAWHRSTLDIQGHSQELGHRIGAFSKWLRYMQQSLGLGLGALLVIDGQITPGAMIAANVLMTRALAPIDMLVNTWRGFLGARSAYARLTALLTEHPVATQALHAQPLQGTLELRDVVAGAPGQSRPILQGISLRLVPGTVTVVMGPSGSGKSTLARVALGLWPASQGQVLLDGQPLSDWDRQAIGPQCGYLPQDIELFDGHIADNIARFGKVDAEKVIEATRTAGLHEMILRLPKGYETPMGEAGNWLSGGQRQRVGLARALYGQPQLVVLDEPNAHLDDVGENALVQAVRALKAQGKTVLLITHRPGVVALADQLVVLKAGQQVHAGPPAVVWPLLHGATATRTAPASPAANAASANSSSPSDISSQP